MITVLLLMAAQAAPPARLPQACKTSSAAVVRPAALARVAARVQNAIEHDSMPSISIAVARQGKIIWSEAFGCSDVARQRLATSQTRYPTASVTKPITATAIAMLAERGELHLDDAANRYLPRNAQLSDGVASANAATVRQLLQHRSGLPAFGYFGYETTPQLDATLDQLITRHAFLAYAPMERYEYSNIGYGVLQRIVEHRSGRTFDEFLTTNLFLPLGMLRSSVGWQSDDSIVTYDQKLQPVPRFKLVTDGAGFVFATAEDIVRFGMFHRGQLKPMKHVSSPEWIERMVDERQTTGTPGGFYGTDWFYALGWGGRDKTELGYRWYGHEGSMPGTSSVLRIWPEQEIVVAVISNSRNQFPEQLADSIANALIPDYQVLRDRDAARKRPAAAKTSISQNLVGSWAGVIHTYAGDVVIHVTLSNQGAASATIAGKKTSLTEIEFADKSWTAYAEGKLPIPELASFHQRLYLEFALRDGQLKGFVMTYEPNRSLFYLPFYATLRRTADGSAR